MDYQYKSPKKSQWGMSSEQDGEEEGNDFTQDFVPPPTPADEKRQELMREYLTTQHQKKQAGLDKDVDDAKTQSKYAGYGDVIGKMVVDYGNSQRQPQQFANRLQDLGKVHQETKPEKQEWQSIQPMFDKNVANAKQAKADSFADMERGIKAKQYGQVEAGMDAGSDLSKKAQMLARAGLLSKAKEAEAAGDVEGATALKAVNLSGMSAMEAKEFYDGLKNSDYKDVLNNLNADKRLQAQLASEERREKTRADGEVKKTAKTLENDAKKYTSQLSKSYWDDDTTKDTREISQAAAKAESLAADKTGKSDVALVYAFAKSVDPRSVVKEQEYKVYSSNGSLVGQVDAVMERAKTGKLTPQERAEILNTIRTSDRAQRGRQSAVDKRYKQQAEYYGVDPKYIFNEEEPIRTEQKPNVVQGVKSAKDLP